MHCMLLQSLFLQHTGLTQLRFRSDAERQAGIERAIPYRKKARELQGRPKLTGYFQEVGLYDDKKTKATMWRNTGILSVSFGPVRAQRQLSESTPLAGLLLPGL